MADKLDADGSEKATKNKLMLRCSVSKYKNFDTTIIADLSQTKLPFYFVHLSRSELIMRKLAQENGALRERFSDVTSAHSDGIINEGDGAKRESEFLAALIELEKIKLKKGQTTYTKSIKELSLFIFLRGGRSLYESLTASFNLPLPSITTVLRHLYDKKPPCEGELMVQSFIQFNNGDQENYYVWASEDDTRLLEGVSYNSLNDTVVGLCLPIDEETGCPKIDFFKFISIDAVKYYVREFLPSNFAKIIILRQLVKGSKPFILTVYGTRGSDNFEMTIKRWEHVRRSLATHNIHVVGELNATAELLWSYY